MILPDGLPAGVSALSTTRSGGVSTGPWASLNLGDACGDDPAAVSANRRRLQQRLPGPPHWLRQVHGTRVIHLDEWQPGIEADAAWTDCGGAVLAIQTADCLPVLLADGQARLVAAAHAGWRGLAANVLGRLVEALPVAPAGLSAWIGPGIGPDQYVVGEPVQAAFLALGSDLAGGFELAADGCLHADLKWIARRLLERAGVGRVHDCRLCTAADPARFFSYRRDGRCGRMASMIWLDRGEEQARSFG